MPRPLVEVADIFRRHGPAYRARHRLPRQQLRLMGAIESCRTASLGGHVERCSHCPHTRISYNSCRNRHCPKCQNLERKRWLDRRQSELLPVPYFHVVFTIPEQLHPLALRNQAAVYGILFQASAQTLLTIAADPRHLGARIGFFSILHTWGQNLLLHPHVHSVVTGGGLSPDGKRWIACRPGFFLSVRVLSRLFRRLFLAALQRAFEPGQLQQPGDLKPLLARLAKQEWVVYAKPPFGGPTHVLDYLGRYTHRVALSNNRLLALDGDQVRFQYKDYRAKDKHRRRTMTLAAAEFIRRFLLHTLPPGFQRIRHYGLLASRTKQAHLALCRQLLSQPPPPPPAASPRDLLAPVPRCPVCGTGQMQRVEILPPRRRHIPEIDSS